MHLIQAEHFQNDHTRSYDILFMCVYAYAHLCVQMCAYMFIETRRRSQMAYLRFHLPFLFLHFFSFLISLVMQEFGPVYLDHKSFPSSNSPQIPPFFPTHYCVHYPHQYQLVLSTYSRMYVLSYQWLHFRENWQFISQQLTVAPWLGVKLHACLPSPWEILSCLGSHRSWEWHYGIVNSFCVTVLSCTDMWLPLGRLPPLAVTLFLSPHPCFFSDLWIALSQAQNSSIHLGSLASSPHGSSWLCLSRAVISGSPPVSLGGFWGSNSDSSCLWVKYFINWPLLSIS